MILINWWRQQKLQVQLALLSVLAIAAILIVDGIITARKQVDFAYTRIQEDAVALAKNIAITSACQIVNNDLAALEELLLKSAEFTLKSNSESFEDIPEVTSDDKHKLSKTGKDLDNLIVEDNVINQMIATDFLLHLGYKADVAENGQLAVEAINNKKYGLVFMDMLMPVMDGIEATRQIVQQHPPEKRPVIIALTANVMKDDIELCVKAGMNDYLAKPLEIDKMISIINKWA